MAGNYKLAPLLPDTPPDTQQEGDIAPNPLPAATYEDVHRFTPREILEWLECIGILLQFREISGGEHVGW